MAYGGFIGPAQAEQRQDEAAVARYREHPELLYLGTAPPGMHISRAEVGPVRAAVTPELQCPAPAHQNVTCTVGAHGEMRTVDDLPGDARAVTLVRRQENVEFEVASQSVDEAGLRHLLDSLHPLSDAGLDGLMRDQKIDRGL